MNKQPQYSTYRNAYRPARQQPKRRGSWKRRAAGGAVFCAVLAAVVAGGRLLVHDRAQKPAANTVQTTQQTTAASKSPGTSSAAQPPAPNHCASNTAGGKLILISVGQRHLWACDGQRQAYESAVVTGMDKLAADLTPRGTYHIYGKQTNLYLNGSDSTGSWHDYVYYWMPFLSNQYGVYGFHDATWRADSDFGAIDPNSSNASHGCVELPLATAKWLYGWAAVGTTVTVEN